MNQYDKLFNEELTAKYKTEEKEDIARLGKVYKDWAKAVVNSKRAKFQKPEWNTPEENRLYTLAVIAELRRKNPNTLTINLSEVPGEVTQRDLNVLRDEYIIEMFKVAAPYQLVFTR